MDRKKRPHLNTFYFHLNGFEYEKEISHQQQHSSMAFHRLLHSTHSHGSPWQREGGSNGCSRLPLNGIKRDFRSIELLLFCCAFVSSMQQLKSFVRWPILQYNAITSLRHIWASYTRYYACNAMWNEYLRGFSWFFNLEVNWLPSMTPQSSTAQHVEVFRFNEISTNRKHKGWKILFYWK